MKLQIRSVEAITVAVVLMISSAFWDITHRAIVDGRRFGTIVSPILWVELVKENTGELMRILLKQKDQKMGQTRYSETSAITNITRYVISQKQEEIIQTTTKA